MFSNNALPSTRPVNENGEKIKEWMEYEMSLAFIVCRDVMRIVNCKRVSND